MRRCKLRVHSAQKMCMLKKLYLGNEGPSYEVKSLLATYQACSPAEALHPSQGRSSNCAHRTSSMCVWFIASWDVRTLLDVEGSVETARQG